MAAENKNRARVVPQTTCIDLEASQREVFIPYALSSSTASDPRSRLQDPRLAAKLVPLRSIHLMFFPEKSVPSFSITMAAALKMVAQIFLPVIRVGTTNHSTQRAANRLPALNPGGVVVVDPCSCAKAFAEVGFPWTSCSWVVDILEFFWGVLRLASAALNAFLWYSRDGLFMRYGIEDTAKRERETELLSCSL